MARRASAARNIILFVGKVANNTIETVGAFARAAGTTYRIALIYDSKISASDKAAIANQAIDFRLACDTYSPTAIQRVFLPYQDEFLAITCHGEAQVPLLARIIPHVPYLRTPTTESLAWSTNKILMRRRFTTHNKKITPAFTVVNDTKASSLKKIEEKVGFPLVVKPAGLAASCLVSICFHREELQSVLKRMFRHMNAVYKEVQGRGEPKVLVEQFMDGDMYSIDGYVDRFGEIFFCPLVQIKTGRTIGFDDFFNYERITPTLLKKESIAAAEAVAKEATHALALRNTTVHVELMKTEAGWKVIELGPRMGGFRHVMYQSAYGINHKINDIRIHMGKKPVIPKKVLGHAMVLKFFAKQEGRLTKLTGIKKVNQLTSVKKILIHKKIGDQCAYAKHGGSGVFDIVLFHPERSKLLADARRLERMIKIETE